jgi:transposase
MSRKPQPFSLPDEAKRSLKELLRKGVHASRVLNRARILLKLDEGMGPLQISKEVDVGVATVYKTRNKANAEGWEVAIAEPKRSGRGPRIAGDVKAKITALACTDPPKGHARWTLRLLADRAVKLEYVDSISHECVRDILKKTSLSLT